MRYTVFVLLFLVAKAIAAPVSIDLHNAPLLDVARVVYGHLSPQNYVVTSAALKKTDSVTIRIADVEPAQAVRHFESILSGVGLVATRRAGVVFIDVQGEEGEEILVYKPLYRSARYLGDVVRSLTKAQSLMQREVPATQSAVPQQSPGIQQQQATPAPGSAADRIDRGEADQLAFKVPASELSKVKKLLADLDTPTGEVLLKAAVYEVGATREEGSALKLVGNILSGKVEANIGSVLNGSGSISLKIGGIDAVLAALDQDSRFKTVSRPQVRVKNGAQARFTVGSDVPVLGQAQLDRNGNQVQAVEYKSSGVIFTATPYVREGVIEVDVNQELSSFIQTTTGVNTTPTLTKRSLQSRLQLQPGEVIVFGGLNSDDSSADENRIPFVNWLVGKSKRSRTTEILLFIEAQRI